MLAEVIFFVSLALLCYTFVGYPVLLFILSHFICRKVRRGEIEPTVTIIIPVHNEEKQIGAKVENCLSFDYPEDKLRIIVVSDNSTDRTENIAASFRADQLTVLRLPFRGGKVAAQNYAVRNCNSDIIIFSDVSISNELDCVRLIVENFNDPSIGTVSCRDFIVGKDGPNQGEKQYIQYDMIVRKYTTQIGSIIGVTGGFYAVRNRIAKGGWNPAFPPDFYVALRSIKLGFRVIEDNRVKAYYKAVAKEWDEMPRKVRTINRGMNTLFATSNRNLLNPFRYGMISVELVSHKVLRWMMPFLFVSIFVSNFFLLNDSALAVLCFLLQLAVWLTVFFVFLYTKKERREKSFFRLSLFFLIANIAIVKSWYEFITGKKYVIWTPTRR